MGKSGKLRKKRKLENSIVHQVDDESSEDEQADAVSSFPFAFGPHRILNAINCLKYMGNHMDKYHSSDCKLLRRYLFPLIEEQKLKHFDPVMATPAVGQSGTVEESSYDYLSACKTFQALSEDISFFLSKDMKPLRRALYPIVQDARSQGGLKDRGISITGEISNALNLKEWGVAFKKMLEMKQLKVVPKLGALQRWVRQCDDVNPKELAILLISLIIGVTKVEDISNEEIHALTKTYAALVASHSASVSSLNLITYTAPFRSLRIASPLLTAADVDCVTIISRDRFLIDSTVLGKDRRPPSSVDMNIYRSLSDTIQFDRGAYTESTTPARPFLDVGVDSVEGVPGALLLSNILTRKECAQFIQCAEMLGYYEDAVDGIEALVWLADESIINPIFERCKSLLPQHSWNGKSLSGINPRLRFFRYGPGAVYRPHIDGAWTVSGAVGVDTAVSDEESHSYYTFLIYLNDGFSGGGTTFFVAPSADYTGPVSPGCVLARSVEPVQGAVLCFPHGVVEGSLIHEGSAVIEGKKYVIRTDLLFT